LFLDAPLAEVSQVQAGQVQASPQHEHDALASTTLASFALSFSQHSLPLAAVVGQQAAPPPQTQPLAEASQVQAGHAQASPQQAHAALVAFVFSAASAPTPIRPTRANAPTRPSIRRRSMIQLPLHDLEIDRTHAAAARSRSPDREGEDDPKARTVILIPGIRTIETRCVATAQLQKSWLRTANAQGSKTSGAGSISDQKTGMAEIEGGFLRRAERRRDRAVIRPQNAARIEPSSRHLAARIGAVFFRPLPFRLRCRWSVRAANTSGDIRAGTPVSSRGMLMNRGRFGGYPDRRDRSRSLATTADRRTRPGIGHRRAGSRYPARCQQRTHERRQGDP